MVKVGLLLLVTVAFASIQPHSTITTIETTDIHVSPETIVEAVGAVFSCGDTIYQVMEDESSHDKTAAVALRFATCMHFSLDLFNKIIGGTEYTE